MILAYRIFLKLRKFDIAEGSRILWTGDPYDADININADTLQKY